MCKHVLFIDCSSIPATVAIVSQNGEVHYRQSMVQQEHAKLINVYIQEILEEMNMGMKALSEVWVCNGPGSYTGLRVGLSAAKGICYALDIPLYTCHLFDWLWLSIPKDQRNVENVICNLAREGEYYSCSYSLEGQVINPPEVVNYVELVERMSRENTSFFSNMDFFAINNCHIINIKQSIFTLSTLIFQENREAFVADLFKSEPFYLKNVHINKINNFFTFIILIISLLLH